MNFPEIKRAKPIYTEACKKVYWGEDVEAERRSRAEWVSKLANALEKNLEWECECGASHIGNNCRHCFEPLEELDSFIKELRRQAKEDQEASE